MRPFLFALLFLSTTATSVSAQRIEIPRRHDKPPGPPISAEEAIKKMTVPEGFSVEIVAAEPDVVNPVGMAIDERGRFWITESFEYPRRSPGPGRDRVKVLEDTDADGKVDKVSVFLDGLNIPSGVAVGHGGVWVANSPDILFVPDADRDGVADGKPQVVVTGFGRTDTHELPNSLTWGPDGWLYGLNGVFNHSHVRYHESNPNFDKDHPGWPLTCAMFRIHPRTREFQVFAEGTSNPWGIAFNDDGEAFLSACVIDHLWHITETGYYHRQGGPYPPFTWKIESIVEHKHQKAAYCGIHWFDSDAYPEQYRRKLYMGNIHGGCINSDRLEKNGSTYKGLPEPDFLTANDAWFMPVVQKTGPDGCLYILDWYDRYHCYQDANADPEGIERAKGRLYRVRYKQSRRVEKGFDLAKKSDDELIELLGAPNDFIRWTATRLLQERDSGPLLKKVFDLAANSDPGSPKQQHALFTLTGLDWNQGDETGTHAFKIAKRLFASSDATTRGWAIRGVRNHLLPLLQRPVQHLVFHDTVNELLAPATEDKSLAVRLQAIIASGILFSSTDSQHDGGLVMFMFDALRGHKDDPLLSRIVWQNLQPGIERQTDTVLLSLKLGPPENLNSASDVLPRLVERVLGRRDPNPAPVASLFAFLTDGETGDSNLAAQTLDVLAQRVQTRQIKDKQLDQLVSLMREPVGRVLREGGHSRLHHSAMLLAASWRDDKQVTAVRQVLGRPAASPEFRLAVLRALVSIRDEATLDTVAEILQSDVASPKFRADVIAALGDFNHERVASSVLASYAKLDAGTQPKAIELLTQRGSWAKSLLAAIGNKQVPANALNQNQVRRLLEGGDEELKQLVAKHWGTIRTTRDPQRVELIAEMKKFVRANPGDAIKGAAVFKKVCGQCHKIYGEGAEVGPDITANGRGNFDQLLSNVFDPSLVIGASYQARTVITSEGRVLTGLPVEENDQRIVLKVQGGKLETIPRGEIDVLKVSELSMMPEQLEKQLKPEELADLFSFLILDKLPSDPNAKVISGVRGEK
jgi:putative membrane-bound dehydrogenase-like protein